MATWSIILMSVVGGGIITFLVTWLFEQRRSRGISSAEAERRVRARDEALDILEGHFINDDEPSISEDFIVQLLRALERAHDVSMGEDCSPIALLEDLQLRFERSRHLDAEEKLEYIKLVQTTIERTIARPVIDRDYTQIIEELQAAFAGDDKNQVIATIEDFNRQQIRNREQERELRWPMMVWISGAVATLAALISYIIVLLT